MYALVGIVQAITKAANVNISHFEEFSILIIKISKLITSFALHKPDSVSISTDFFSLHQLIEQGFEQKNSLSFQELLNLADHCYIGFLPGCSFYSILKRFFDEIGEFIKNADTKYYHNLIAPIHSDDINIVSLFLTIWVTQMETFISHPFALTAIFNESSILTKYASKPLTQMPAQFLLDSLKASSEEQGALITNISHSIEQMKKNLPSLLESSTTTSLPSLTIKQKFALHKTNIQVLKKKKWVSLILCFSEESGVIMFSTDSMFQTSHGFSFFVHQIKSLSAVEQDKKQCLKIKIQSKEKLSYSFKNNYILVAFHDNDEVLQWQNIFCHQSKTIEIK